MKRCDYMNLNDEIRILLITTFSVKAKNNLHIVQGVLEGLEEAMSAFLQKSSVEYTHVEDAYFKIEKFKPALTIVFGSAIRDDVDFGTLTALAKRSESKTVFWVTDDPYEFDARNRFVEYFDLILTNDFGTQPYYFDDRKVHHLPLAASEKNDYREIDTKRDIEYFFCGYPYQNRKVVMQDLCKVIDPSQLTLSRGDWGIDGCNYVEVNSHEELIDFYVRSKYVLNVGRTYNLANSYYSINPTTPGPRTFEAALAGSVQIYISPSPEISEYYLPSEEILITENVESVPGLIQDMFKSKNDWESVARAAQKRTLKDHLYKNRVSVLINLLAAI